MLRLFIFILVLLPQLASADPRIRPSDWAQPVIGSHLSNIYRVDTGVYRSEQPDREGFLDLSQFGVQEILSLREYHSDDTPASNLGLTLHRIKIDTSDLSEDDVVKALNIILKRKGPILVHCWHGSDRTGAIIASYRIIVQGWSKESAIDELINGGYGYHSTVFPNVVELINSLNVKAIRTRIGLMH